MFDRQVLIPLSLILGFFVLGAVWMTSANRNPPRTHIEYPKQNDQAVRGGGSGPETGEPRNPQ
jgi:hypothetical protein